jgi:DNA-directed RNA polymerase sigma subunit (sigma70/sigma32)
MEAPNEFQPLIDEIFREKVLRARAQSTGEKLMAGLKLFEDAVVRMRGGIQAQFPRLSAEEVEKELYRRIERIRQIEDHGFYQSTPPI